MFYPKPTKWHGLGGGPAAKFTVTIAANYEPVGGTTTATTVRFPVLNKPADISRPAFGIAERKQIRQDNWSLGWGQFRFADKNRFWYGTAHTFRDNEISAAALLNNPSTNITAASVAGFAEYTPTQFGPELLTNTTFDSNTTGWTATNSTLASVAGGQSNNCLQITNVGTNYGIGYQAVTTTAGVTYRVTVYHKNGTSQGALYIGTSAGGSEIKTLGPYNDANWTLKTEYFTAVGTTTYITFRNANNTDALTGWWDEASVKYASGTTGSSRTLYAWAGPTLYSYTHSTEVWADASCGATNTIIDAREENGILYVTQHGANYRTLTNTTWADGGSIKEHFCFHDGTLYASGDHTAATSTGHKLLWGAAWASSVEIGGGEDTINAVISFKGDLYVLKTDGLYVVFTKPADSTVTSFTPSAKPVQTFSAQRGQDLGKRWAIWGDRLWFNCGTSLAYFDGLDVVLVEYPWSVAPAPLSDINSITAMDDVLVVGFTGYVLAYHDKGAGTAPSWHHIAYLGADTRKAQAVWFSRIPATSRLWIGLDEVGTDATNTKYLVMQNGLFMPSTFAASSVAYLSWMDDSDQTINKWLMEAYVEVDNCDANNTVTLAYATDGGSSFTDIGTAIVADGIAKRPASGYVGGSTLVSFRSIQLRLTIVSAGSVSPIVKAVELVFQPKPPDRRQFDLTVMCKDEWEVGTYTAQYTPAQYRAFLWAASQQDTPVTYTDEYGTSYTVSLVLGETVTYSEDGLPTGSDVRLHLKEV